MRPILLTSAPDVGVLGWLVFLCWTAIYARWRAGLRTPGSRLPRGPAVRRQDLADVEAEYDGVSVTRDRPPRPTLRQRAPGLTVALAATAGGTTICIALIGRLGLLAIFVAFASLVAGVDLGWVLTRRRVARDAAGPRPAAGYTPVS